MVVCEYIIEYDSISEQPQKILFRLMMYRSRWAERDEGREETAGGEFFIRIVNDRSDLLAVTGLGIHGFKTG